MWAVLASPFKVSDSAQFELSFAACGANFSSFATSQHTADVYVKGSVSSRAAFDGNKPLCASFIQRL